MAEEEFADREARRKRWGEIEGAVARQRREVPER